MLGAVCESVKVCMKQNKDFAKRTSETHAFLCDVSYSTCEDKRLDLARFDEVICVGAMLHDRLPCQQCCMIAYLVHRLTSWPLTLRSDRVGSEQIPSPCVGYTPSDTLQVCRMYT